MNIIPYITLEPDQLTIKEETEMIDEMYKEYIREECPELIVGNFSLVDL